MVQVEKKLKKVEVLFRNYSMEGQGYPRVEIVGERSEKDGMLGTFNCYLFKI
jgi:hypothetical protein